jgi:hypothetical protein
MIEVLASLARRAFGHPAHHPAGPPGPAVGAARAAGPPVPRGGRVASDFARLLGGACRPPAGALDRERAHQGVQGSERAPAAPPSPPGGPAPGEALPSGSAPPAEPQGGTLQQLWPALVRRVAWEGDARRATLRLELGTGALRGVAVLLECDGDLVHVRLSAPADAGADLDAWRGRIAARLARAGLAVDGVD